MQRAVTEILVGPIVLVILGTTILLLSLAWRILTGSRAATQLCPKCLYNVETIGPAPRCPECGIDLARSGVIPRGARVRKRLPFLIVAAATLCFVAPLFSLSGELCGRLNILQTEERRFEVLLTTGDPQLNVSAMSWYRASPFAQTTEIVQLQFIAFPGTLTQHYHHAAPSTWSRTAPNPTGGPMVTTEGTGSLPVSEAWAFAAPTNLSPTDPAHAALVESLATAITSGPYINLPTAAGWRNAQSFGPSLDRTPSTPLIVILAIITLAIALLIIIPLWRRRSRGYHTVATRAPLTN